MKKNMRLGALLLALTLLGGCTAPKEQLPQDSATLPPYQLAYQAPLGQMKETYTKAVQLYLPSNDGTRLTPVTVKAALDVFGAHADTLLQMLFTYQGDEAQPLPLSDKLALDGAVEVSCGIAAVNLNAAALALNKEQLYIVFQAIANTLCHCESIDSVNLLIDHMQVGIDDNIAMPIGALAMNEQDDLNALRFQVQSQRNAAENSQRFAQQVTLYFPAAGGMGVLCENRLLSFANTGIPHMARTLLDALSEGPKVLEGQPTFPPLHAYLTGEPLVSEKNGERVLSLAFSQALNDALLEKGITRSCMAASLVYTLTTYLPGIAGIEITIGSETLTSLTPEGTYQGAGQSIRFQDGVMRRSQFADFLLSMATLYFSRGDELVPTQRAVPCQNTSDAYYLISQLIQGPAFYDTGDSNLKNVMPHGMMAVDVLGTNCTPDGVALINFSARFAELCSGMDALKERLMVYALVNTLTELENIREVCFFVNGTQPDHFASALSLPGTFLRNADIIAK